ncbi:hypothetical protein BpHYR1_025016 [Brachionus plicatilis]|uniref:Uncharacterized protein n=1 Tax=Brachionus plicatilis TaxID=10195 RepID=A0A3M7SNM7_BRAPC|nr:hypothetical protein BpHYR1_025016 [Brachionus plicatilis]
MFFVKLNVNDCYIYFLNEYENHYKTSPRIRLIRMGTLSIKWYHSNSLTNSINSDGLTSGIRGHIQRTIPIWNSLPNYVIEARTLLIDLSLMGYTKELFRNIFFASSLTKLSSSFIYSNKNMILLPIFCVMRPLINLNS